MDSRNLSSMMKLDKKSNKTLSTIAAIAVLLFSTYQSQQIFGHDFAGDESASFLSIMDQIQTEMNLINTNLIAKEKSLAQDHFNKINELYTENIKKEIAERNERIANEISSIINETNIAIGKEVNNNQEISETVKTFNDVKEEAISVRIDQDALNNATVHALHFADLINSIDASYAIALGTKPMNMSAMNMSHSTDSSMSHNDSNMMSSDMEKDHADSSSNTMTSMSKDTEHNSNTNETSTITNIASYQTAKELTNIAIDLFNSTIKKNIPSNDTETANTIEISLVQLKDMIESKAPYNKVIGVIHGPIQTTMLDTFNLPLKNSN
jgi:hypothetical protein